MQVPDINVLIYAHRGEVDEHERYAKWLEELVNGDEPFGASEMALFGFVRIVTNRRAFKTPTPIEQAFSFCEQLVQRPNCLRLRPGERHWEIFARLCTEVGATGKLVADAHHAAIAIEHGGELISADSDFARFPGLRWRHPLSASDR